MELVFINLPNIIEFDGEIVYLNKRPVYEWDYIYNHSTKLKSYIKTHSFHFKS
jgi:hypothetical protein